MSESAKQLCLNLTPETRLNQVLENIPGALEYIISLNPPDFNRLHNPFMRKYMSPRISLRRVAVMGRVAETQLLHTLAALGSGAYQEPPTSNIVQLPLPQSPITPPTWLENVEIQSLHWVDILSIDDAGGDPFPPISIAVKQLTPGKILAIRHRWEPQPLYDIWQKMRLQWFTRQVSPNEWHIFVYKPTTILPSAIPPVIFVELRHLSPAEIIPRVLTLGEQLIRGQSLQISGATPAMAKQLQAAVEAKYSWQSEETTSGELIIRLVKPEI